MALKLKSKIALGGIFLFALLLLVGIMSFYYFNRITTESKDIIKDNYETLNYSRDMLRAIDELALGDSMAALTLFENNLQLQESNITEPGEKEMTNSLRKNFETLRKGFSSDSLKKVLRKDIYQIMNVNLQAIDKKNKEATISADSAKGIITLILTACILLGITFLFNFPSLVATPIAKLTEGIKAIAAKNYGERIHLNRKDEFGELVNAFNSMAEKLDEYEHSNLSKILFEKQRAETVINSLRDASIGIDIKGRILFANQQALQLLSLKEQDLVGQQQQAVEKRNDLFRFLVHEQSSIPFKIVLEGKENYFSKELIDITQEEEKTGFVIVLKNITSFKELDAAKTNFLATISHELKTPLASSDFGLKLLEDERIGTLSTEQKDLIKHLKDDNQRMLKILSELLNMSQVEAGKMELRMKKTDPLPIIDNVIASVHVAAQEKNITIEKSIEPSLPTIYADIEKTGWVLNNFLTNAIKFSSEGSKVILSAVKQANKIIFSVTDQGVGISEEYQKKIFDRYFKIPGNNSPGTGLGLAISKEFIEAMKGRIWVTSTPGLGSSFSFELPLS